MFLLLSILVLSNCDQKSTIKMILAKSFFALGALAMPVVATSSTHLRHAPRFLVPDTPPDNTNGLLNCAIVNSCMFVDTVCNDGVSVTYCLKPTAGALSGSIPGCKVTVGNFWSHINVYVDEVNFYPNGQSSEAAVTLTIPNVCDEPDACVAPAQHQCSALGTDEDGYKCNGSAGFSFVTGTNTYDPNGVFFCVTVPFELDGNEKPTSDHAGVVFAIKDKSDCWSGTCVTTKAGGRCETITPPLTDPAGLSSSEFKCYDPDQVVDNCSCSSASGSCVIKKDKQTCVDPPTPPTQTFECKDFAGITKPDCYDIQCMYDVSTNALTGISFTKNIDGPDACVCKDWSYIGNVDTGKKFEFVDQFCGENRCMCPGLDDVLGNDLCDDDFVCPNSDDLEKETIVCAGKGDGQGFAVPVDEGDETTFEVKAATTCFQFTCPNTGPNHEDAILSYDASSVTPQACSLSKPKVK
jgi:hypothetical protein